VSGTLNLRSVDGFAPGTDNYWDFVLGSGTFKRGGGGNQPTGESTSATGRIHQSCPWVHFAFSALTLLVGRQEGHPAWILLKQETVSGSGISWAICKSAPRSRQ